MFIEVIPRNHPCPEKILILPLESFTVHKMKFSIKDFFSKCDQVRSFLRIWSHLLEKSLTENFVFCKVIVRDNMKMIRILIRFFIKEFTYNKILCSLAAILVKLEFIQINFSRKSLGATRNIF